MPKENSLITQFVNLDLRSGAKSVLEAALKEHSQSANLLRRDFEFNCFDVTIDFSKSTVFLYSILDTGGEDSLEIPLADFIKLCGLDHCG